MKVLKHPLVVIFFIVFGVLCGLFLEKGYADIIGRIGDLYIDLIQVTVIPILISAIIASLARLIKEKSLQKTFKKIVLIFSGAFLCVVAVTMLVGFVVAPGTLSESEQIGVNKIIKSADTNIDLETRIHNPEILVRENPFWLFFSQLISSNIFHSLGHGNILEIVFFCFILGTALGKIATKESQFILSFIGEIFHSIQVIISWILYFLPFGLFAIVVKQVSSIGVETLGSIVKFLLSFVYVTCILGVGNVLIVWKRSGMPLRKVCGDLFEIIILPITTRNSFACISVGIETLTEKLYFDRVTCNMLVPLSFAISRIGNIAYFCLASMFIAQIYQVDFSVQEWLLLPFASIIAGIATAGASGFVTLQALSIVAVPLGLPIEAILVILYLIDPFVDPLRTFLIVNTNLALIALVAFVYPPRAKEVFVEHEEELDVTKAVLMQMQDRSSEVL